MSRRAVYHGLGAVLFFVAEVAIGACPGYPPGETPDQYSDLAQELSVKLDEFALELDAGPIPGDSSVHFGATLTTASGNRGAALLEPDAIDGSRVQLDGLIALGIDTVTLVIPYPVLDPAFFPDPEKAEQLLDYYRQVAAMIHDRGLKLVIVNMDAFSQGLYAGWPEEMLAPYYALGNSDEFDIEAYRSSRAEMAMRIAEELRPDFLTVVKEPYTSAVQTGISALDTPEEAALLATRIVEEFQSAGITSTAIGAGIGNWQSNYLSFIDSLAASPVDYIDINVWKITDDSMGASMLLRLLDIALIAADYEKPLAISDAWLGKASSDELQSGDPLQPDILFARDKYEFWSGLDSSFIELLVTYARQNRLLFFSAYGWGHFRAYYPYSSDINALPVEESQELWLGAYGMAVEAAEFSETGRRYSAAIRQALDSEAPTTPANFDVALADLADVALTWGAASDNVGTAGYRIYRNGEWLLDTPHLSFVDEGLDQASEYIYEVASFDLMCNESPKTPEMSIVTPDIEAPSSPTDLRFTDVGDSEAAIAWSSSTDNVGVDGYRVYVGATVDELTLAESTVSSSWRLDGLYPESGICVAVDAFDAEGNISPMSSPACATTGPDITPPTVPVSLAVTAVSETQIDLAWSASQDNAAVWRYRVFVGTDPNHLAIVDTTPETVYSLEGLPPGLDLYATVDAVDAAGNASAQHEVINVQTRPDESPPSTPEGLKIDDATLTGVTLSWQSSEDNVAVYRYHVFAGVSEDNMSLIASVETTQYELSGLYPGLGLHYSVAAVDGAGNVSAMSDSLFATTVVDAEPPSVPEGLSADGGSINRIDLTWLPAVDNYYLYGYLVYIGRDETNLSLVAFTKDLHYSVRNLPAGISLYFALASIDIFGNVSERSAVVSAQTLIDGEPPTTPQGLSGYAAGRNINLSWTASDDAAGIRFYIVQAGRTEEILSPIKLALDTQVTIGPVPAGIPLFYSVQAVDRNGNRSELSAAVSVTATN